MGKIWTIQNQLKAILSEIGLIGFCNDSVENIQKTPHRAVCEASLLNLFTLHMLQLLIQLVIHFALFSWATPHIMSPFGSRHHGLYLSIAYNYTFAVLVQHILLAYQLQLLSFREQGEYKNCDIVHHSFTYKPTYRQFHYIRRFYVQSSKHVRKDIISGKEQKEIIC